jgi:hypothetical protein
MDIDVFCFIIILFMDGSISAKVITAKAKIQMRYLYSQA